MEASALERECEDEVDVVLCSQTGISDQVRAAGLKVDVMKHCVVLSYSAVFDVWVLLRAAE